MDRSLGKPLKFVKSYEARQLRKRPITVKVADLITQFCGSVLFFVLNISFFGGWIVFNTGLIPAFKPIDPFPFPMLTTIVSLEAIILSIFVLMSQNRQSIVTTLRDEIELQMDLVAEREITKILHLIAEIAKKQNIKIDDKELDEMLKDTDVSYIERELEKQLMLTNQPITPAEIAKAVTDPIEEVRKKFTPK